MSLFGRSQEFATLMALLNLEYSLTLQLAIVRPHELWLLRLDHGIVFVLI